MRRCVDASDSGDVAEVAEADEVAVLHAVLEADVLVLVGVVLVGPR